MLNVMLFVPFTGLPPLSRSVPWIGTDAGVAAAMTGVSKTKQTSAHRSMASSLSLYGLVTGPRRTSKFWLLARPIGWGAPSRK
jgi:hypothetical protein